MDLLQRKKSHTSSHNSRQDSRHQHTRSTRLNPQQSRRLKFTRRSRINRSIPAVIGETLGTDTGECSARALKGAGENSTAHAGSPVPVASAVSHGGDLVPIEDDIVTLGVVV